MQMSIHTRFTTGTDGPAQGIKKPGFSGADKQCYFHVVLLLKV